MIKQPAIYMNVATEECVWKDLAGRLSASAVSSAKEGAGSQNTRQASYSVKSFNLLDS